LLTAAHGVSFESYERAIDSHIRNLRRKLGATADAGQPEYIETIHGVGYKFSE
jgi:DNA-binding response OmpR family regulator